MILPVLLAALSISTAHPPDYSWWHNNLPYHAQWGSYRIVVERTGNDGEDLGVDAIQDLNGDGVPEIITRNPVLGDFSGYNFHRHWPVITILGWNGRKYVDVTCRYPGRSMREARARQADIVKALHTSRAEQSEQDVQDLVSAYYANMLAIGRGQEARRWLHRHLPPADW